MQKMIHQQKTTATEKAVAYVAGQIRTNPTRVWTVVGFTLGIIVAFIFYIGISASVKNTASDSLSQAYYYFATGDGQKGVAQLDSIISGYKSTPSAYQARLMKADILTAQGDYKGALALLEETFANANPKTLRPLALNSIIYVYDRQKDFQNAILRSREFINKFPKHFLVRNIHLNLANYYVQIGDLASAVKTYNEILMAYPASAEADFADAQLKNLK